MQDRRWLVGGMLVVDVGFLVYWAAIATGIVPTRLMFAEHLDPAVAAWNWSFLPLDVAASMTGFVGLRAGLGGTRVSPLVIVSLTLTATAGGMALAYWALRGQVDPLWWIPNAGLLVFGVGGIAALGRDGPGG